MHLAPKDQQLLDRVSELNRYLNEGAIVRLSHSESYEVFLTDFRKFGERLRKLGRDIIDRTTWG